MKAALRPMLDSLERPVAPEGVVGWKRGLLRLGEGPGERSEAAEARAVRVSFAAAALLLLLDFRMPEVEGASSSRLAEHAVVLADVVQKTSKYLDANARKLDKLLAYRSPNRPAASGRKAYEALVAYRMGEGPDEVARGLGITPYRSSPTKPGTYDQGGTREWKDRLARRLSRGAGIEGERFPLAAAVLRNRHKARVVTKAKVAHHAYDRVTRLFPEEKYSPWPAVGERIRVSSSTDWGHPEGLRHLQGRGDRDRDLPPLDLPHVGRSILAASANPATQ